MVRTSLQSSASGRSATPLVQNNNQPSSRKADSSTTSHAVLSFRFLAVVLSSFILSGALHSIIPNVSGYQLATVSRSLNGLDTVLQRLAYKFCELGYVWYLGYDGFDYLSLLVLYSAPYYFLLYFFYDISAWPIASTILVDLFSNVAPMYAFRSLNPHNKLQSLRSDEAYLASINTVDVLVSGVATSIYALVTFASLRTYLPVYLLSNFDSLRSLHRAHDATFSSLLVALVPLGLAAKSFLFVPSLVSPRVTKERRRIAAATFDPQTATLQQTLQHNLGFLASGGERAKILASRAGIVSIMTFGFAWTKIFGTIEGAESLGALGLGSVFALGSGLVAVFYLWMGGV